MNAITGQKDEISKKWFESGQLQQFIYSSDISTRTIVYDKVGNLVLDETKPI